MHPSILEIHRTQQSRPWDILLWSKDKGFLVSKMEKVDGRWAGGVALSHGMTAWAVTLGRENKPRLMVKFDEVEGDFVFPEVFRMRKADRRQARLARREERKIEIDRIWRGRCETQARSV
ncbi:MAG: hypothetical protein KGI79_00275 [Patescibacteria group bacterium]|nr:hypothetical protein [Patescibacteria group bacterium]MDE2116307.1 hypothetical protein [Patescibacteria group bacterium]